jgi:sialate O-acetylesterase
MRARAVSLAAVAVLLVTSLARAEVFLPALFTDSMVLQRDRDVRVWGWADPGTTVKVRFRSWTRSSEADEEGAFSVTFPPSKAGGPYTLTVAGSDGTKIELKDVLVGDVWLCSGQSNMAWPLSRAEDGPAEAAAARIPGLRLITVPRHPTPEPQADFRGRWTPAHPKSAASFSAVAFFFGRELRRRVKVPIGLIHSSVGGTPAEAWTPPAVLEAEESLAPLLERWAKQVGDGTDPKTRDSPYRPGNLYQGMIHPLLGASIRGAIWYQGESNASRADQYRTIFPLMIHSWREAFGQGDFPFYFVQLANFRARAPEPGPSLWAELRDAQFETLRTVPHTGMAVAIDIGEEGSIHPTNKQEVGARLARWALDEVYGKDIPVSGPLYEGFVVKGNEIVVSFSHHDRGLRAGGDGPLTGFSICGEDRKFVWATARISGNEVVVGHPDIVKPVAVRYAWAENPECNLVNGEGLPASPFRTDDWAGVTVGKD